MASVQGSSPEQDSKVGQSVPAELCRMVWLAFGPVAILFTAAELSKKPPWTYSTIDVVYFGFVLLAIVTKLVHVRQFHGLNTENKPSTMADFWGYALKLGAIAGGLWFLVQSFQM